MDEMERVMRISDSYSGRSVRELEYLIRGDPELQRLMHHAASESGSTEDTLAGLAVLLYRQLTDRRDLRGFGRQDGLNEQQKSEVISLIKKFLEEEE